MDTTKTKVESKVLEEFKPLCLLQTHIAFKPIKINTPEKKHNALVVKKPVTDFGF